MAAAEDVDGDRVIEIVSAGVLYHRGGDWERKYWSCSRVTSTEGDSATGQTPDMSWNFQKETGAKVKNWQRRKSFPQKIDGAELFGFKNASIQRLLRELIVDSTGVVERNLPCEVAPEAGAQLVHKDAPDVSEAEDLSVFLGMESGTAKKSVEPSQLENTSVVNYPDMLTSVDNCNASIHINTNEGGTVGKSLLQDASDSRCVLPLLEEVPGNAKSTSLDNNLGELSPDSSQQVGLSSGSYLSSEKSDIELAEKEVAKSMMSILLPKAIPFLMKTYKRKKSKHKKKENSTVSAATASAYNPSDGLCGGVTVPTIMGEGANENSSVMCDHWGSHHDMVKNGFANDDCRNDESVFKLDEMNGYVANSFDDDAQTLGANTTKAMGNHHLHFEDACCKGPNEESTVLNGKTENFEYQVHVDNGKNAHDVGYDHQKGHYTLSDSLLACLEDEFGEDSSHPANYNQFNGDVKQFEQQFKELSNGRKNILSASVDVSDIKNTGKGSIDVCAHAFARHGSAVSRNGECLANILPSPVHSNAHNETVKCGEHDLSATLILPPASVAKSSLMVMRDERHDTEVLAIDQKEKRCQSVSYKRAKSDDNTNCHPDNVEFVDKHVAFESSDKGMHSSDGPQRVSTIKGWPVGDNAKAEQGNSLGKFEECQAGCKNGNKNTMIYVCSEGSVGEHIPPKGENDVFHHQSDNALSVTNCADGLVSEYTRTQAWSDHHLELVGCYLHPMPVLSIMLNAKNHNSFYIYVLCGLLESCQRFLYAYTITPKEQKHVAPCFVGYTPLLLPTSDHSSAGNFPFGRSGLHFTPDGQFLVLLSSIRMPSCRMQNIDCLCSVCKLGRYEDNSLKIVSVNLGYVSLVMNLMPYGTVSCILVCEPNYIVAIEDSTNLHIWEMVDGWSEISEQYVIPSLGNMGPSVLELRRMPKTTSLILGHDGAGGFCLWDISKRTLLATYAAPGNIVFQILPVGFCSLQEDIIRAPVDDIDKKLQDITVRAREYFMMPPREDIAVWVLISSASVAEYQHDLRSNENNARWRLALLVKNRVFMGNILDTRVTALDASGDYGYAGTHGGLLYLWELSSGRKVSATQCFNRGRVFCVAADSKSCAVAVTDGGCQLLLYTQDKVQIDAVADGHVLVSDE